MEGAGETRSAHARVQTAMEALAAAGEPISANRVNRWLRSHPPYYGMSFRDLLPLLKIQAVPTPAEQALQDLEAMSKAIEQALADQAGLKVRQRLSHESEAVWLASRRVMLQAAARGDDVRALTRPSSACGGRESA
jgi:hypothetical protein